MNPEIPIELLQALADSADQTGCTLDVVVVSSIDLAAVLRAAGIRPTFELPDDDD